jgi:hypothetical protein
MAYYRRLGDVPRKRHSQFRGADGRLHTEELVGEQGFFHSSSLLYHRNLPNLLVSADPVDVPALTSASMPSRPLIPRLLRTHSLPSGGDAVTGRRTILANDDIRVCYAAADRESPLFRNALGDAHSALDCDEIMFFVSGAYTARVGVDIGPGSSHVPSRRLCAWAPSRRRRSVADQGKPRRIRGHDRHVPTIVAGSRRTVLRRSGLSHQLATRLAGPASLTGRQITPTAS